MKKTILQLKELITQEGKNIVITTHRGPDGDALGSSLAMYHFLIQFNHKINVITPTDYASFLHWLPDNDKVINFEDDVDLANRITKQADIIFLLDFNNISRLATYENIVKKSNATKILIDHHEDPDYNIADIIFSDPHASATAEIIYTIISQLDMTNNITKNIAECLYVGIMTDTGSFKYSSTTSNTHEIIAKLISFGADNAKIHNLVFENSSSNRIKLLGYCLNEKLLIFPKNKSAIISLTEQELNNFNFKRGDTEGIVNYALSIKDIIFATFIVEREGVVKLSLRSIGNFKVNEIAKKYFNGGGHINAAGGVSQVSVNETIKKVEKIINKYTDELNNIIK